MAEVVDAALHEPVIVTENGKRRTITKLEAMTKQLANKGASGDARVAKLLMDFLRSVESQAASEPPTPTTSSKGDREILDNFILRMQRFTGGK